MHWFEYNYLCLFCFVDVLFCFCFDLWCVCLFLLKTNKKWIAQKKKRRVSSASRERLCCVCVYSIDVDCQSSLALTLYEKLINWLFRPRERSPRLPRHPCSLPLCFWPFFPSLSLSLFLLSLSVSSSYWNRGRTPSVISHNCGKTGGKQRWDERVRRSCGHSWGSILQGRTPGGRG